MVTLSGIFESKAKTRFNGGIDFVRCLGGSLAINFSKNLVCKVRNWYHQKMMFFQIIWLLNFLSSLIKKQPFIIFLLIKQRIYDYFSEFASEALHIVIFENFVIQWRLASRNWKLPLFFASLLKSLTTWPQLQSNLVIKKFLIRNKLMLRNHFPRPNANLLHKDKEQF